METERDVVVSGKVCAITEAVAILALGVCDDDRDDGTERDFVVSVDNERCCGFVRGLACDLIFVGTSNELFYKGWLRLMES